MSRKSANQHDTATSTRVRARLPGDLAPSACRRRMIRVDQAGEFGAKQIYKGQLAILAGTDSEPVIRSMAEAEDEHLEVFDRLLVANRVRPTALTPLWRIAGFALGAGTALMGEKAAMACTAAVEDVIDEHYQRQADQLGNDDKELKTVIERFQADERHHRETALAHGAETAPGYRLLSGGIKRGTRLAIWLSERV